ncbi:hypothetical protein DPMN_008262 [Dreissena polymorpha]|uniref:Uncharacterized protein n=1 Tax=Dreissena polymorpha TaxID=45954 RepID=A0A9D4MV04_DREPO|nr:hypothetical protein DPMN_008262 [Dreissena polymorpha]
MQNFINKLTHSIIPGSCYSDEYRCHNGRCISDHSTCNGYNPCGDNSDCSLAAGAIAGIVIGTLIGFSLCIAFVVVCRRRRRHVS